MLTYFKEKLTGIKAKIRYIPPVYLTIPTIVLICSLVIRLTTGSTHIVYNVLGGRGIFPGAFTYTLLYTLRLLMCSVVLVHIMCVCRTFKDNVRVCIYASLPVLLMLFEYRLIFGGISLILAMVFSILSPVLSILSVISAYGKNKYISVLVLIFAFLQLIFFVQLISLAVCI